MDMVDDLTLTAEQRQYRQLARQFAEREIAGKAAHFDSSPTLPTTVWQEMQALGLVNVRLPEDCGGLGLNTLDACLFAEELGGGCSGIASASETSELAIMSLVLCGGAAQKEQFLRPLASKPAFAGLSLTYFEAKDPPLRAVKEEEKYLLSGCLPLVINAQSADWLLVEALLEERDIAASGSGSTWACFILPTRCSGLQISPLAPGLGRRAADRASLSLSRVEVSQESRLHINGDRAAFLSAMARYNHPVVAAGCIGVARAALTHAFRYARQRHTFGKPIFEHQAVSFMIADMARDIEAARLLVWRAAKAADAAQDSLALALAAKAYAQEIMMRVCIDAVQIFGGYGYTKEYPVEKLMRDAKVYQLFCSTSQIMKGELGRLLLFPENERV